MRDKGIPHPDEEALNEKKNGKAADANVNAEDKKEELKRRNAVTKKRQQKKAQEKAQDAETEAGKKQEIEDAAKQPLRRTQYYASPSDFFTWSSFFVFGGSDEEGKNEGESCSACQAAPPWRGWGNGMCQYCFLSDIDKMPIPQSPFYPMFTPLVNDAKPKEQSDEEKEIEVTELVPEPKKMSGRKS